jgi:hypothetical protein
MCPVIHTAPLNMVSMQPCTLCREARIAARRKRVQDKLAAVRAQAQAAARSADASAATSQQQPVAAAAQQQAAPGAQAGLGAAYPKAAQQVAESQRRLLRLRHRTTHEVTSVRVAADEAEAAHRAAEEQLRQVRLHVRRRRGCA